MYLFCSWCISSTALCRRQLGLQELWSDRGKERQNHYGETFQPLEIHTKFIIANGQFPL